MIKNGARRAGMLVTAATVNGAQALQAVEETGNSGRVKIASIDLTPDVLQAIEDGKIMHGLRPPLLTKTGPAYIKAENAEQAIELSGRGIR